ncbi:hypothetical protein L226DRAFT_548383 [Lentinus tigrinus ALCF2SS1-7]|uniref:Uncharacterized protein n=1 Tax=Lentinus tigrinus ALCF2SS1-6 TaxID=1328759 RepID=A0A5C2RRB4_9APHY|nr:hypothetical protein L227DRAFT_596193 [Lentinus tigrinus ALCF2SS1-6]RPD68803.1 hypothetical protein L226DRAFT_548383 [Lentinus tigrinus ALCF2SS1-7]
MSSVNRAPVFPSPFRFQERDPCTLIELRMRYLSGKIRAKPNWWEKINDATLVSKWRQEMVDQDRAAIEKVWGLEEESTLKHWPRDLVTDTQLDYIFDELRYVASRRDEATGIYAASIPNVYETRSLIPADLKSSLLRGVSMLESVSDEEKDWHPGSNGQVLDLVHPSLYCFRIGRSCVYADSGAESHPRPLRVMTEEEYRKERPDFEAYTRERFAYSSRYQWLPTDFKVSDVGIAVPLSYINNLHPVRHRDLYPTVSSILERFVPLFERVLSDIINPEPPYAITVDPHTWYDHLQEPVFEDDPDWSKQDEWEGTYKWPLIPEPPQFQPPSDHGRETISLKGRTLQVIVKLANIVLTPEKPRYEGGAWHVEGMSNERIVATGLYYYACENISESRLDFRMTVGTRGGYGMVYQQSDDQGYLAAYGFMGRSELNQQLGHIVAEEDKCVAFPNIYQHHVDAFELADPSQPGYRKILCFFLVNPTTRILSTSDVPPQQQDWVVEDAETVQGMQTLPQELYDIVTDYAQTGTISREEAERNREEFMKERAHFIMEHNEEVFEVEFNMCEH